MERYRRPLLRACRAVLPHARAEDALQHTLLSAWGALRRGDDVHDLRPWLYRIARNTALNQLRISGHDHARLSERVPAPGRDGGGAQRHARARGALAQMAALPESQRVALLHTALHGRSHAEVADELGTSPGAVRAELVHRARMALRAACGLFAPPPLAAWLASAGGPGAPMTQRVAELTAGAGAGRRGDGREARRHGGRRRRCGPRPAARRPARTAPRTARAHGGGGCAGGGDREARARPPGSERRRRPTASQIQARAAAARRDPTTVTTRGAPGRARGPRSGG